MTAVFLSRWSVLSSLIPCEVCCAPRAMAGTFPFTPHSISRSHTVSCWPHLLPALPLNSALSRSDPCPGLGPISNKFLDFFILCSLAPQTTCLTQKTYYLCHSSCLFTSCQKLHAKILPQKIIQHISSHSKDWKKSKYLKIYKAVFLMMWHSLIYVIDHV